MPGVVLDDADLSGEPDVGGAVLTDEYVESSPGLGLVVVMFCSFLLSYFLISMMKFRKISRPRDGFKVPEDRSSPPKD